MLTRHAASRNGIIVTADDFGLHMAVNEAVELAYRNGVLKSASLMVAAPAAGDAIDRARNLPELAVGLHLVLADGQAALPSALIPDLVNARGRFSDHMALNGFRFFSLPKVRRQLASEIRAQFDAFAATGLTLDHVNAHKHFHLHPTVLSLILKIGTDYGLRAVRVPSEPGVAPWLRFWILAMRRKLDEHGILYNDYVFGIAQSGSMDEAAWLDILSKLPEEGLTEIYGHPATQVNLTQSMHHYRHTEELKALLSPRVRAEIERRGLRQGGYLAFQ